MNLKNMRMFAIFASLIMLTIVAVPMVAARRTEPITIQPITTFEDAIRIAERFLQVNPDGTLILNMPIRMVRSIGRDHYDQLQAGIAQTNKMISQGYLKVGENFDVYVTEKYINTVKANIALHQQSLTQEELQQLGDISVFRSGNSITTIGILGGGAGVTRTTWHWWGFVIYWCRDTVIGIRQGSICLGVALAIAGIWTKPILVGKILSTLGVLVFAGGNLLGTICRGRGVRLTFNYMPHPNPPFFTIRLTHIQPQ